MKKIFKRAISILTITAILATSLVTALAGSVFAEESETVVEPNTEEWFYDFKSGTGTDAAFPAYLEAHSHSKYGANGDSLNSWATYKSDLPEGGKTNYYDDEGFHYFSYYKDGAYDLNFTGDVHMRGFFLWDADIARQNAKVKEFSEGTFGDGSVRNTFPDTAEDGNLYVNFGFWSDPTNSAGLIPVQGGLYSVTVRYRVSEMNTATNRINIGVAVANYASSQNEDWNLLTTNYLYDYATITEVMDDWATLTVLIDGWECKNDGMNYIKVGVSNDKYVHDGETYNQIDFESIKVERLKDVEPITEDWLYDFKSGTGTESAFPAYMESHPVKGNGGNDLNNWATHSSGRPANGKTNYFDNKGFHYYSYHTGTTGTGAFNLNTAGDAGVRGFFLWDADIARQNPNVKTFSEGKFGDGTPKNTFPDTEDNANLYVTYGFWSDPTNSAGLIPVQNGLYAVTVKFKVSEMNTATSRIDIGVGVANYDSSENKAYNLFTTCYVFDYATVYKVMDDWATITVFVDGSMFKGKKENPDGAKGWNENYLKICVGNDNFTDDGTYNQIDFESIKVKRLYDAVNNETGVRFVYPQSMTKDSSLRSIDYYGLEPVLMSANEGTVLPNPATGSNNKELYRWMPYDISEDVYAYFHGIGGYFENTDKTSAENAVNYLSTYPGATYKPGVGAFGLGADIKDTVAPNTTTTKYTLDVEGLVENKEGLWANGTSAFMSTDIYKNLALSEDGGLLLTDTSVGNDAWFENMKPYEHMGIHRIGFYTGANNGTENAGNWWYNSVKLKNGATYKVKMTFKFEYTEEHTGTSLNIGMCYPIIKGNYWTWANVNAPLRWRYINETDGYVTVEGTFEGNLYNDGHFLAIALSCNGNNVIIQSAEVTETFVGTFNTHGVETSVEGTSFIEQDTQSIINGYINDGNWYADAECTIPATEFNSKIRTVYAGGTKKFDVNGIDNGNLIASNTEDGLVFEAKSKDGYKLAAGGITVTLGDNKTRPINSIDGNGNVFAISGATTEDVTAIDVSFVNEDKVSLDVIAASIRRPSGSGEEYQSAGLRFRGRVTNSDKLVSAGFVLIPTELVSGDITINTYNSIVCETGIDEIVYYETDGYKDFQVKLTGLSSRNGSMDLTETPITCVMFVKLDDGSIVYSDASSVAYSDIAG